MLLGHRLLHQRHRPHATIAEGLFGIPRHVDDDDLRTLQTDGIGQLGALHSRHDDIGQEYVDGAVVVAADLQRNLSVTRGQYRVPVALEDLAGHCPQRALVLDDEHRLGRAVGPTFVWRPTHSLPNHPAA